jgi:hypothetical protein
MIKHSLEDGEEKARKNSLDVVEPSTFLQMPHYLFKDVL